MTVLDILASTEINSLARGCAFSHRLSHIIHLSIEDIGQGSKNLLPYTINIL